MKKRTIGFILISIMAVCLVVALVIFHYNSDSGSPADTAYEDWFIPIEPFSEEYIKEVYDQVLANEAMAAADDRVDGASTDIVEPVYGNVIANINGKPYTYDLVYLYRLTTAAWDRDPNIKSFEAIDNRPNIVDLEEGSSTGDLLPLKLRDTAVYLELLYLESKEYAAALDEGSFTPDLSYNSLEYDEILSSFKLYNEGKNKNLPIESLTKIVVAHENAKFYRGQSNENYWRQVEPFMAKYSDILQMNMYFFNNMEQLIGNYYDNLDKANKEYYKALKEKYNVEMVK